MIKKLFLVLIFSLCLNHSFSQNKVKNTFSLDSLLIEIQQKKNIFISYNTKIVAKKQIVLNKEVVTVLDFLNEIEKQTNLVFQKIGDTNYILKRKKICGYLINENNNEVIPNSTIVLIPSGNHAFTDAKGYFDITLKNNDTHLLFNTLGFNEKKISLTNFKSEICTEIYLQEQPFALDEIVINNYLTDGFSKKIDNSILINPTKSGLLPGVRKTDVLQSIQLLSGIHSPNDTATGLNIRGSTPDHNLILWDGIKLYRNDHFFGMISAVNANIIDNVTLFKNSSPSFYGSHLAGVIDIQSDNKIPERTKWGIGMNSLSVDTYLKTKISKKLGVFISARRSFSDIFETGTFANFYSQIFQNKRVTDLGRGITVENPVEDKNNQFNFTDITTKLLFEIDHKHTLSSSFFYFKNKLKSNLFFNEIDFVISDALEMKNIGIGTKLKTNWNDRFSSNIKFDYVSFDYDYSGRETISDLFDFDAKKTNTINEFNFDALTNYKVTDNYNTINGISINKSSIDFLINTNKTIEFDNDINIESNNGSNLNTSIYSQHEYISDKWFLRGGIRADYFNTFKKVYIQPSIYISNTLNDVMKINFSAEVQYQAISQITELSTKNFGLENQVWIISNNEKIPLLRSDQISLGASYNKKNWLIDASVYYKKITNLTSFIFDFAETPNNINTGKSIIKGIEFFIKRKFNNFNSQLSYTYTDNNLVFPGINNGQPFQNGFNVKHDLSLIQSYKYKKLQLTLGWKYKTSRPFTPATNLTGDNSENIAINYGEINSAFLNNFHRMDFSAEYNFKFKKDGNTNASIGFELLNLYNQSNPLIRKYRITVNPNNVNVFNLGTIDEFSIARTPIFSFRVNF